MRVTYFVTTIDSGAGTEKAAITQANIFAARGHDVTILSVYKETGSPVFALARGVQVSYLVELSSPTREKTLSEQVLAVGASRIVPAEWDNQFSLESDVAISQALGKIDSDILVTTTPALTALAVEFASPEMVIVEQEHRATSHRTPESFEPIKNYAPRIDCLVSLTERSTLWLRDYFKSSAPRLETIPNSIPEDFYPKANLESRLVMSAGRFVAGKNFVDLIRAFAIASAECPGWKLRIYGHGPLEARMRGVIRTLRLENQVELVPPVPNMLPEWSKASIFAMSSRSEGLPLVALEAMAAGLPLVAYDCETGPAEIIQDDVNGLLVPDGNMTALAESLQVLMSDSGLRQKFSHGSLERVTRFSPESIYLEWEKLFTDLIQTKAECPDRVRRVARQAQSRSQGDSAEAKKGRGQSVNRRETVIQPVDNLRPSDLTISEFKIGLDVLTHAAVPFFWIPGLDTNVEVLAVASKDKEKVLVALQQASLRGLEVFPMKGRQRMSAEPWLPSTLSKATSLVQRAMILHLQRNVSEIKGGAQPAALHGCQIEFWDESSPGIIEAPRPNLSIDLVSEEELSAMQSVHHHGYDVPTVALLSNSTPWSKPEFQVDVVYTWVDDSDPKWALARAQAQEISAQNHHSEAVSDARFTNRDELKYSLRSLEAYAPWVRHIYLVTAGQRPTWLADHPDITLVDHSDLFPEGAGLPTFNSHAIEAVLHRIEGLSEHYLYLNDDVLFARPQKISTYFMSNGASVFFPSSVKINDLGELAPPHLAAASNNRQLIKREFGLTISQTMIHAPHALTREVGYEIEDRFHEEWQRTIHSKFREKGDLSVASSLAHYLSYATKRSVPGSLGYRYINLGAPDLLTNMNIALRSENLDIVALGDPADGLTDPEAVNRSVRSFLEQLLPWPSRFER